MSSQHIQVMSTSGADRIRLLCFNCSGRRKVRPVSKIIIDYVDINAVANGVKETKFIKTLQTFLLPNLDEKNGKYLDKLFYLGPLYHWIFPNLKKLIFMEVGTR